MCRDTTSLVLDFADLLVSHGGEGAQKASDMFDEQGKTRLAYCWSEASRRMMDRAACLLYFFSVV